MTTTPSSVIERSLDIAARPEIVFRLLTDPKQILRWQGLEADVDAQPGGIYRVKMNALGHTILGRFIEVTPVSRVVFTWGWEHTDIPVPAGSTTVEITLTPSGNGTLLHLLHRGLPPVEELVQAHSLGWDHYIERLAAVAEGRPLEADDPWAAGSMGEPDAAN
jgi:uncharacterized protein YndB with AHSA1/START domain